jgi:anti-sigma regulatory factor (Ser/Thr protein kinase)
MCRDILRTFSETSNGEAAVQLMLRHIALMTGTSSAAIYAPGSQNGKSRRIIALPDWVDQPTAYDPCHVNTIELPIEKEDTLIGTLHLTLTSENETFSPLLPDLTAELDLLSMALSKWIFEKKQKVQLRRHEKIARRLERQNSFLHSLYKISLDIVRQKDYARLMNTILIHAQNILGANFASIYLLNERLNLMEMKFIGPNVDPSVLGISLRQGQGGAGLVWTTGKFMVIHDYANWGNRVRLPWLDNVGTIAFLPLYYLNKMIGIICLGFADIDRTISPSEKSMLQQFANLAAMVSENVQLLNALVKRDEEFTRDIDLAAEVQQAYLPFHYDDPRLKIKTFFQPLHTVSGDLYDYFWGLKGDTLFGYVADVTGHGVTAGLRTSALSALFREAAQLSLPLVEKMKWVHGHSLGYFSEGAYFAGICFELDLRRNELKVVCGGLYEFFMKTRYFTGRVQLSGSLMGLKRTPIFEERIFPARDGDCFYFLTDGFAEQLDPEVFPNESFTETCDLLEKMRMSSLAWDDMAGIGLQLKPDKKAKPNLRPELQLHFVGFDEFHAARLQVTDFVERHFPADADDILLAFHEAAGNALRHGSDTRPVFVRIQKYTGYMSIRIKDSGRGFDSQTYLSKTHRDHFNLQAYSGRGISIMLECMDKVYYSLVGNEVLLLKKMRKNS